MAKNKDEPKKSFILFKDTIDLIEDLDMEQRGRLFTAILEFENWGEIPDFGTDILLKALFRVIQNNLIRTDAEYDEKLEQKKFDGKVGGIIRGLKKGQELSAESRQFLTDNGMLNREWLEKNEIDKQIIDRELNKRESQQSSKGSASDEWDDENLPFS